jgi:methylenetetrahydrofolate reductase (NADPH)
MSLAARFAQGPVFSLEVFPPKREGDVDELYRVIDRIAPLKPDYISVTYGAGGSNVGLHFEITRRLIQLGITPLPHFTCVGQGRDEIKAQLDRLAEAGVRDILALRGDPPKGEAAFKRHPDGFAYASELVAFIRGRYDFSIGAACYPEKHPEAPSLEADLAHLKSKVEAGVDFLNCQMFFDNSVYHRFCEKARSLGIRVPIIPGIMPVQSARFFGRDFGVSYPEGFREGFGVSPEADRTHGLAHAVSQCEDLMAQGAPGLHLYIMNKADVAEDLWGALDLSKRGGRA